MAEIIEVDPVHPQAAAITRASELLRKGEVVAIPTDTVYGLAADPFDGEAIEKIFSIKGRPKDNPILLLVDSIAMVEELSRELPPNFYQPAKRFWPGPLTIVVEASPKVPASLTAN